MAVHAATGINEELNYQGILKDSSGAVVSDGSYDMVFKLYTATSGGSPVWTGTYTSGNGDPIQVTDGVFSVLLGSGTGNSLAGVNFNQDTLYLGITVGSDSEMTPRLRVGAAAYAINSAEVNGLSFADSSYSPGDILYVDSSGELQRLAAGGSGQVLSISSSTPEWVATSSLQIVGNGGSSQWTTGTSSIYYTTGNVGIGTTSPWATLSVQAPNSGSGLNPVLAIASTTGATSTTLFDVLGNGDVNIPAGQPSFVGATSTGLDDPAQAVVAGRYAYVANTDTNSLVIMDVSNPAAPSKVSSVSTYLDRPQGVAVAGRYAYVTSFYNNALVIFDVSNPAAPVEVGSTTSGLSYPYAISVEGRYAYVASENTNAIVTFDVSNPAAPVEVASASTGLETPEWMTVVGRYAYVASYNNSAFVIFDLSNPANPVEVSSTGTNVYYPEFIAAAGNYAYLANTIDSNLLIFNVSNPAVPVQVASFPVYAPQFVTVAGRYAYLIDGHGSVITLDVSNPAHPVQLSSFFSHLSSPTFIAVDGHYAYVSDPGSGSLVDFDLGGLDVNAENVASLEAGTLQVRNDLTANGDLAVGGGLNVGIGGIFSAGSLAVASSSVFDSSLGIGTTSPYATLSVQGTSVLGNSATAGYFVGTTTATSTLAGGINITNGCFSVNGVCVGASSGAGSSGTQGQLAFYNSAGTTLTATSSLFLAQNGNVGIGTTSPFAALSVAGSGYVSGTLTVGSLNGILQAKAGTLSASSTVSIAYGGTGISSAPAYGQILVGNTSGGYSLVSTSTLGVSGSQWTTGNSSQLYYDSGAVGIGTNAPDALLSVAGSTTGTGAPVFDVADSNNDSLFRVDDAGNATTTGIASAGAFAGTLFGDDNTNSYSASAAAASGRITFSNTSNPADGDYVTISDGSQTITFEFDNNSIQNIPGSTLVTINPGSIYGTISNFNNAVVESGLNLSLDTEIFSYYIVLTNRNTGPFGNQAITTNSAELTVSGMSGGVNAGSGTYQGYALGQYDLVGANNTFVVGTGIDNVTSGSMEFGLGSSALSILSNGNVGIGTTSPFAALSVAGSGYVSGTLTVGSLNGILQAKAGTLSASSTVSIAYGGTGISSAPAYGQILVGNTSGGYSLVSTSTLGQWTATSSGLSFTNGSIGIGTTSPWLALAVQGASDLGNFARAGYFVGTTSATSTLAGGLQASALSILSATASSTFADGINLTSGCFSVGGTCLSGAGAGQWSSMSTSLYYTTGNVGIGTSSPYATLADVSGSSSTTPIFLVASSTAPAPYFQIASTGDSSFGGTGGQNDPWQIAQNHPSISLSGPASVTANGYVYLIGGYNGAAAQSTVLYAKLNSDGSVGTWATSTNALPSARYYETAVTANGFLYVIGGYNSGIQTTVYYARLNSDGSTGAWQTAANALPAGAGDYTASSVVANGFLYQIAGSNGVTQNTLYYAKLNADGSVGPWTLSGNTLPVAYLDQQTSVVANGYVYVIGGTYTTQQNAVYYAKLNSNGSIGSWTTATNSLPDARAYAGSAVANGYVYVIGGLNASATNESTVYYAKLGSNGAVGTWLTSPNSMPATRVAAGETMANGYVYMIDGLVSSSQQNTVYYASLGRTTFGGSIDLLGLASTTDADAEAGGSVGGSIFAGDMFSNGSLTVLGNTQLSGGLGVNGIFSLAASSSQSQALSIFSIQNATGTSPILTAFYNGQIGAGTTTPGGDFSVGGLPGGITPLLLISSSTSAYATSTALVLDKNGFLGLGGTSSPGSLLSLGASAGGINFSLATSTFGTSGGLNIISGCYAQGGNCLSSTQWSTGTGGIYYNSGTIGISTTSPDALFAIGGGYTYLNTPYLFTIASSTAVSTTTYMTVSPQGMFSIGADTGVSSAIFNVDASSSTTTISNLSVGNLTFDTDAGIVNLSDIPVDSNAANGVQEAQSINIGGNPLITASAIANGSGGLASFGVSIGTSTTPYSMLQVWGPNSTGSTSAFAVVNNASSTEFSVYDNGNAVLAGSLTQNSDERLKTNVADLDASSTLAAIEALNPVSFNWIDPNQNPGLQLGFIAQQVQQVFPNLVSTTSPTALTPDGTLSVNYIGLISPLIEAVKALAADIEGFAQKFTTQSICLSDASGASTCITKSQLDALLATSGQNSSEVVVAGSSSVGATSSTTPPASLTIAGSDTPGTTTPSSTDTSTSTPSTVATSTDPVPTVTSSASTDTSSGSDTDTDTGDSAGTTTSP